MSVTASFTIARSRSAATCWRWGWARGDRVAFCLANSPRIMEVIYGCFAAGLIVVPVNARLHAREIAYIVGNSGARVLIHGAEYQDGIIENETLFEGVTRFCTEPAAGANPLDDLYDPARALTAGVEAKPEDLCWLFYTSGTTGKPKGAMWNHRMVRCVIMNYLADLHNIQPGEMVLHCAPMSHGSGIIALPTVARGAVNAIMDSASFDVDALLATVERLKVSHIAFMAPTQIVKMLEEYVPGRHDISSLKAICYGGAPIYVDQLRKAVETFGSIFVQLYGQGESPITITGMSARLHQELLDAGDARIGSAGQIRTDVEAHCVDADDNPLPRRSGRSGGARRCRDARVLGQPGSHRRSAARRLAAYRRCRLLR
ncbi:AMP-binding protein [Novosphingobium colocasiae]